MPTKNSIQGEEFRWPRTVPYILEDSLGKMVFIHNFHEYVDLQKPFILVFFSTISPS